MADRIQIVDRDGKSYHIDPSELESARRQGYGLPGEDIAEPDSEKYDNPAAGAGLGALRGVSLGLSDVVASAIPGGEKYVGGIKENNPISSTVGEIGGSLISPANEIAGAAEALLPRAATALGRVGTKAVGGAAVGSLFGAGNAVSEAALGDSDLTAQKLIAHVGLGGVLGLAGGAIGETVGEGVNAVKDALGASGGLKDFAAKQALRSAGFLKTDIRRLGTDEALDLGHEMLARGYVAPGRNAAGILEHAGNELETHGQAMGGILDAIDQQSGGKSFDMAAAKARIADELGQQAKGNPIREGWLKDALSASKLGDIGDKSTFAAANDIKSALNQGLYGHAEAEGKKAVSRQIAGILNEEIETQLKDAAGTDVLDRFLEAKKGYGVASKVASVAEKQGVAGLMGNRSFSLTDYLSGGAGAAIGGLPGSIAGAVLNRAARTRGPSTLAYFANKIAESPALEAVANHFALAASKPAAMSALGAFGPAIANAIAHGPADGLAHHLHLSQTSPDYQKAAALAGFPHGTPKEDATAIARAHGLSSIGGVLDKHDDTTAEAAAAAVAGGGRHEAPSIKTQDFGAKQMRRDSAGSYGERVKQVRELAANPNALVERVSKNLGDLGNHAPGTAAATVATAQRAVKFLASKSSEPLRGPLAPKLEPGPVERQKFARHVEAVQDPMTVLRQAKSGHVTPEALESVKAVYPQLWASHQSAILIAIAEHKGDVSRHQRALLSRLTGSDLDGSSSAMAMTMTQAVYHRAPAKSGEDQAGPAPTQGGASKLTLGQRSMTTLQQTAQRER